MIRGSLTASDWACLRRYARRVSKFILTDKNSDPRISLSAFIRLARLQSPDTPLLPSLSDLVIEDADASIAHLDLLLTPSLKSLTASCIPDAQQSTFFCFLTAVKQEVPLLQTVILGPGQLLSSSLQTISEFNNLRHLELKHEKSELPCAFFDNIGSLPKLEILILDARYVSNTITGEKPITPPAFEDVNFNGTFSFSQLARLHVIGQLPFLKDLIPRIRSTRLEKVSVTFVRLSYEQLKASLAKEEAEQERRELEAAEQKMKEQLELVPSDEAQLTFTSLKERKKKGKKGKKGSMMMKAEQEEEKAEQERGEKEIWAAEEQKRMEAEENKKRMEEQEAQERTEQMRKEQEREKRRQFEEAEAEKRRGEKHEGDVPYANHFVSGLTSPVTSGDDEPRFHLTYSKVQETPEAQERLLKQQFDAHTASFTNLLRNLYSTSCRWSLKSVSVCQLDAGSFESLLLDAQAPILPKQLFQKVLQLPAIEILEVKGWHLDFVEGVLNTTKSTPNLKSLLLPLDESNFGISLHTLRCVAQTCPKLETFQCHIESLSLIPKYPIPTNAGISHGLRKLSVTAGDCFPISDKRLYDIARHLYLLFPNLETIDTPEEHNAAQWVMIGDYVKMFQTARLDDLNRQ